MTITTPSAEAIRADARENLLLYSQLCDHRYKPGRMHGFIAKRLMETVTGGKNRIILNTPPRHGKTTLVAVEFATWLLGRNPRTKIVLGSYGQSLADKASKIARERITSPEYKFIFPNVTPSSDTWTVDNWQTTERGGFRSIGVDASFTGFDCDVLLLDDLHKDFAEANSETKREHVWEWFLSVAMTRLMPNVPVILIGTRWHPDDITGRLINPDRIKEMNDRRFEGAIYRHINLPAIAEGEDHLGRSEGEALWPERFPIEWLDMQLAEIGSHMSAALYMGRPVNKGGNYIDPDNFEIRGEDEVPPSQQWMRYWDIAVTENKTSDYTVGGKGLIDSNGNLWIQDVDRGQWEWPKARRNIVSRAKDEGIFVGVEAVGGLKGAFQNLQEIIDVEAPEAVVREYGVDKDKLTRALPWIALTEKRKVILVRSSKNDWIPAFKNECEEFPRGSHDDQIDMVSGLYAMLKESLNSAVTSVPNRRDTFSVSRNKMLI